MQMRDGTVRAAFIALTVAVSSGVATFFTLYSLIPAARAESPEAGSLYVGVLMTCVIAVQVGTPALVRRFSLRSVVLGSLLVLGVGALATGIFGAGPLHGAELIGLLAGGVVSGVGFGVLIVAGSQGVGLLVPGLGLGQALGMYGLVTMLATALGSPAGVQLALSTSPAVLGAVAAGLCVLGAVFGARIPRSTGKHLGVGRSTKTAKDLPVITTPGALRLLALTLVFLLLAVLFLAHGITSLPAYARGAVEPALTILLVQIGAAAGRWLGGAAEVWLTRVGAITLAGVLVILGASGGMLGTHSLVLGVAAIVMGAGVGTAQTVGLHMAMRRIDAGRASVVWNLAVDGGLWLGGVLAGLALAQGILDAGILASACLLAGVGAALAVQEHRRERPST
ncbi:MFS transporter [Nesterenkonia sp. CF4.4]|uniref:MFS transporter n=1 Tax=Nesterenkonia sp. CF4.4 TaxID=3373079 RepID=UPI003EE78948